VLLPGTRQASECSVRVPSKVWCILQAASRCRVRANHPPVSSVALTAEPKLLISFRKVNKVGEAYTENCAGRREFATSESWYSFEMQAEFYLGAS
jgi:hypothetical protein